jgi:hypothetical protein
MSFDSVTVLSMVYYGTVSICELRHPVYGSGPVTALTVCRVRYGAGPTSSASPVLRQV